MTDPMTTATTTTPATTTTTTTTTLGGGAPAHGDAGLVDRLVASRNQPVPPVEIPALRDQPVGAGLRQPAYGAHIGRGEPDAVGHAGEPVGVVRTPAGGVVEQAAAHRGPVDFAGILVLKLGKAAFAAAVAERFPLGGAHFLQRLGFPERLVHGWHVARRRQEVKRGKQPPRQRSRHRRVIAVRPPGNSPVLALLRAREEQTCMIDVLSGTGPHHRRIHR